ncbi:MAG: polymer-forming cytoskeletal protein [Bacteroidota bacterium]
MKTENNQQRYNHDNSSDNTGSLNSGKGDYSFQGNLIISGIFSGRLNVSGTLTLGVDARLTGEVVVNDLIMFGQMMGTAKVINSVVFHNSSVFSGALTASEAEVYSGSRINGKRTIGRIIEREAVTTFTNNRFNIKEQVSIPDEMTHSLFRL